MTRTLLTISMQSLVPLLLTQQSNFGQAYKKNTHRHVNKFRHSNLKKKIYFLAEIVTMSLKEARCTTLIFSD